MPNNVTPSIPENDGNPQCAAAFQHRHRQPPKRSGSTPKINAAEVMMIGRSRSRQASMAASRGGAPWADFSLANSTIRIAFLLAKPTNTMKPICTKILMSIPASATPIVEHNKHIGTTRITASGKLKLSYWAAQYQETPKPRPRRKTMIARVAGADLQQREFGPLRVHPLWQYILCNFINSIDNGSGADAGQRSAIDGGRGNAVVANHQCRAAYRLDFPLRCPAAPCCPSAFRTFSWRTCSGLNRSSRIALQIDLPGTAELVEVVGVITTQIQL